MSDKDVIFDEGNPEWTEQDFARAKPGSEVLPRELVASLARTRGRPALAPELRKKQVTLRLSPDVLEALRRSGRGWQSRVDHILRRAMQG
jgi:uncharacterized protein (DUF4415 family)